MLRKDLEAAGIPFEDRARRVFDLHALRHQYISSLAAAGVHPKEAQELARHSTITLTMVYYTHLAVADVAGAVDRLPEIPAEGDQPETARATGTDDPLALQLALNSDFLRPIVSASVQEAVEAASAQETPKPSKNKGGDAESARRRARDSNG